MKKLFLSLAVVSGVVAFAQQAPSSDAALEKGKWMIGSNVGLNFSSESKTVKSEGESDLKATTTSFSFNPDVSYFMAKNLAVGVGLDYTYTSVKDEDSSNSFGIMPNVKYFFANDSSLAPFVGLGVGYRMNSYKAGADAKAVNQGGLAVGVEGGVAYFLSDALAATGSVKYNYTSITHSDNSNNQIQTGKINAGIGVAFFF